MSSRSVILSPLKFFLFILIPFYLGACTNHPGVGLQDTDLNSTDHIQLLFYDKPMVSMNTKTETNFWKPLREVDGFYFSIQNRDSHDFPNCVHLQWGINNDVTSIQLIKGLDTEVLNGNGTKAFAQEAQNAYMTADNFWVVFDDNGHHELGLKDEFPPTAPIEIEGRLSGMRIVRGNAEAQNYWKEDLKDAITFGNEGNTKTMICAEHGEDIRFYLVDETMPPKPTAALPAGGGTGSGGGTPVAAADDNAPPAGQTAEDMPAGEGSTLPGGPSSGDGGVVATSTDSGGGGSSACPMSLTEAGTPNGDLPVWLAGALLPGLILFRRRRGPAKGR